MLPSVADALIDMQARVFVAATDPRVQLCGRHVSSSDDATVKFDWPAIKLTLAVKGSARVWLRMDGNKNIFSVMSSVSSGTKMFETKSKAVRDYLLPVELSSTTTESTITIFKRTEARPEYGVFIAAAGGLVTLHGILLEVGGELLPPPPLPTRKLEVYGDSDSCAFGCEAKRTGTGVLSLLRSPRPRVQDASRSFPLLLGTALDAQVHLICWSGIGACWNAPFMMKRSMSDGLWQQTLATDPTAGSATSRIGDGGGDGGGGGGSWLPNAVLVYLGGNDFWTMGDKPPFGKPNPERSEAKFVAGFVGLLAAIRAARPAPIPILVLAADAKSASCCESKAQQMLFSETMARLSQAAIEQLGDEHMRLLTLCGEPELSFDDDADWGTIGHMSVQGHAKVALALERAVAEALGHASIERT